MYLCMYVGMLYVCIYVFMYVCIFLVALLYSMFHYKEAILYATDFLCINVLVTKLYILEVIY